MDKMGNLKEVLGDARFTEVLGALTEKEKTALGLGLTTKEDKVEDAADQTTAKTTEAETQTEAVPTTVDVAKLTEAIGHVLKPLADDVADLKTKVEMTAKDSKNLADLVVLVTSIQTKLGEIETTAKVAKDGVAELKGDVSRSTAKSLRASEKDETVTTTQKETPMPDPQSHLGEFIGGFVLSKPK